MTPEQSSVLEQLRELFKQIRLYDIDEFKYLGLQERRRAECLLDEYPTVEQMLLDQLPEEAKKQPMVAPEMVPTVQLAIAKLLEGGEHATATL